MANLWSSSKRWEGKELSPANGGPVDGVVGANSGVVGATTGAAGGAFGSSKAFRSSARSSARNWLEDQELYVNGLGEVFRRVVVSGHLTLREETGSKFNGSDNLVDWLSRLSETNPIWVNRLGWIVTRINLGGSDAYFLSTLKLQSVSGGVSGDSFETEVRDGIDFHDQAGYQEENFVQNASATIIQFMEQWQADHADHVTRAKRNIKAAWRRGYEERVDIIVQSVAEALKVYLLAVDHEWGVDVKAGSSAWAEGWEVAVQNALEGARHSVAGLEVDWHRVLSGQVNWQEVLSGENQPDELWNSVGRNVDWKAIARRFLSSSGVSSESIEQQVSLRSEAEWKAIAQDVLSRVYSPNANWKVVAQNVFTSSGAQRGSSGFDRSEIDWESIAKVLLSARKEGFGVESHYHEQSLIPQGANGSGILEGSHSSEIVSASDTTKVTSGAGQKGTLGARVSGRDDGLPLNARERPRVR